MASHRHLVPPEDPRRLHFHQTSQGPTGTVNDDVHTIHVPSVRPNHHSTEANDPLSRFHAECESSTRFSAFGRRQFRLASRITDWFGRTKPRQASQTGVTTNLEDVVDYLCNDTTIFATKLYHRIGVEDKKCWLRTFAILLLLSRRTQTNLAPCIEKFFDQDIVDSKLVAAASDEIESIFASCNEGYDHESLAIEFQKLKWQFCCEDALHDVKGRTHKAQRMILPFTRKEMVGYGGTGNVYMVTAPVECIPPSLAGKLRGPSFNDTDENGDSGEYRQLVLKVVSRTDDYEKERYAYEALRGEDGVVKCYGYWQYLDEYHFLLEPGFCDLAEFFEVQTPPNTADGILNFWESLCAVASALANIHRLVIKYDNGSERVFLMWHCDMKPTNIIYCKDQRHQQFKIADPGFSTFVEKDKAQMVNGEPVAELYGGTPTYCGPEIHDQNKNTLIYQSFDIWSLGCILSEAASWLIHGQRGVKLFRYIRKLDTSTVRDYQSLTSHDERMGQSFRANQANWRSNRHLRTNRDPRMIQQSRHNQNSRINQDNDGMSSAVSQAIGDNSASYNFRGLDLFHDGQKLSQGVKDWHTHLCNTVRKCDNITSKILDIIERHMLVGEPLERLCALEVADKMQVALSRAKTAMKETQAAQLNYRLPTYLTRALEAEQEDEAAAYQRRLSEASTDSVANKYKSMAFKEAAREPLSHNMEANVTWRRHGPNTAMSHIYDPRSSAETVTETTPSPVSSRRPEIKRAPTGRRPVMDYMKAREELDRAGWKSGVLDLPATSMLPPQAAQTPQPATTSATKRQSQVPSTTQPLSARKRLSLQAKSVLGGFSMSRSASGNNPSNSVPPQTRPIPTSASPEKDPQYMSKAFNEYFENRDIVFLVDNAPSMAPHWLWVKDTISILVALLYGQDDNGMDLYMTSSKQERGPFTLPKQFVDVLEHNQPGSHNQQRSRPYAHPITAGDDIRIVLYHILNRWAETFPRTQRKLTLIVLTDGIWAGVRHKHTVANEIIVLLDRFMDNTDLRPQLENRGLSIQFLRFGDDGAAIEELDILDTELESAGGGPLPDIIDHEPVFDGDVYKMILGSLVPDIDGEDELEEGQKTPTATSSTEPLYITSGGITETPRQTTPEDGGRAFQQHQTRASSSSLQPGPNHYLRNTPPPPALNLPQRTMSQQNRQGYSPPGPASRSPYH